MSDDYEEAAKASDWERMSHLYREARHRLKLAHKTMGRQGRAIANLRGELARTREEHTKIDRGDIRRLERENANLCDELARQRDWLDKARAANRELREKLEAAEAMT